jgi:ATP synthase protein I
MPEGTRDKDDGRSRQAEEAALAEKLRRLGERLDQAEASEASGDPSPLPNVGGSALARGMRLTTELVSAVLAGAGVGWLIDRWLGTSPWGFIVLLLLGFAAGVVGVVRAVSPPAQADRN